MAFKGRKATIFGAFKSKKAAKRSERKHAGSFILPRKIRGSKRFVVIKQRGR